MVKPSSHAGRTERIARALERAGLAPGDAFPCPYLPGRAARHVTLVPAPMLPGVYHSLMDLNFRRMGPVFYRPRCDGCDECRMIRVSASDFRPSRAQRRCLTRNRDLEVERGEPLPTPEKHRLYQRYLEARHDGQMDGSLSEFRGFLHTSQVVTLELTYRLEGRLLGVGIADCEPEALSAVYCYYEPNARRRGLGVFNLLTLLEECRRRGLAYLYLGYHVRGCARMSYKAAYRPCEILRGDRWEPL